METLEVAITAHPVAVMTEQLEEQGRMPRCVPASELGRAKHARVVGLVAATRRVRTKRGEPMLFLTLEDPSGLSECTLFPSAYARLGRRIDRGAILMAEGTVEAPYGVPTVTVERLEPLVSEEV
jgi:DNA polymerase III alpha subunit